MKEEEEILYDDKHVYYFTERKIHYSTQKVNFMLNIIVKLPGETLKNPFPIANCRKPFISNGFALTRQTAASGLMKSVFLLL